MNRTEALPSSSGLKLRPHLLDFDYAELEKSEPEFKAAKYRLSQVCDWVFGRRAESFVEMSNLPADLREDLSRRFVLRRLAVSRAERSRLDGTVKLTFEAPDHGRTSHNDLEPALPRGGSVGGFSAVFLPHKGYNTLCISTQVGCAWKCGFCASGLVPFQRNLSSGEILDQVFRSEKETGEKVANILFMGMGEPLANFEGTVRSIGWMTSPKGLKMNPGRITLSTTGVAPMIEKLARLKTRVNLALSLHAPTDELRRKVMPVSSKFPIKEVLAACKVFQTENGSDFTIEYILLKGVNDDAAAADRLAMLLRSARFSPLPKINLIPHNPVEGVPYHAPDAARVQAFFDHLKGRKFVVHTRKPQGQDIEGACGQLL